MLSSLPETRVLPSGEKAAAKITARCTVRGTHTGDTLGFAATQAPMEITGISIVRIQNGKIVEGWNNFDFMTMYKQLGAI